MAARTRWWLVLGVRGVSADNHLRRGKAERLDLAAPVRATRRADAVRALGLVALRALHERGSRELVRRSPLVAAGLGGFSLGDGHCGGEV